MKNGKQSIEWLLVALLPAVTFFVFGSIDMFFSNQTEFWFSVKDILLPCLAVGVVAAAVGYGILWLTGRKVPKIGNVVLSLIFSLGLALYIQGNFMVMDYGVLDGKTIQWENYIGYGVLNTAVWLICIAIPLVLLWKKPKWFHGVVKYAALLILAVQVITMGVLFITHPVVEEGDAVFTSKNEFELSPDENVVVFILDSLDAQYVNSMLEEYPETEISLQDFTYFDNASGICPTTNGSLGFIATGVPYYNQEPYDTYLTEAYCNGPVFQAAEAGGYEVDIYSLPDFAVSLDSGMITNLVVQNYEISEPVRFSQTWYKLIAFRYVPHFLKQSFWLDSTEVNQYSQITGNDALFSLVNKKFWTDLTGGLSVTRDTPVLKIYHLAGTHPPLNQDDNLEPAENPTGAQQTRGCFRIVEGYLDQLRELGLYDSASIVIMADHGIVLNQCPAILIKRANDTHEKLQISHAPVSYITDWPATLTALMGQNNEHNTMFDIPEDESRTRFFYWYTWNDLWDSDYLPTMYEYCFTCAAKEMDMDQDLTGVIYRKPSSGEYSYSIGEICVFDDEDFWNHAVKYGFSDFPLGDMRGAWMESTAKLELTMKKKPKNDIVLHLDVYEVNGFERTMEVIVNGTSVGKTTVMLGDCFAEIMIPAENLAQKNELEFRFSENPREGSGSRERSISITSVQLREADRVDAQPVEYPAIKDAVFLELSESGGVNYDEPLRIRGIYHPQGNAAWSSERVQICFKAEPREEWFFNFSYGTYYPELDAPVLFNGVEVARVNNPAGNKSILLPSQLFSDNQNQTIEILIPCATLPAAYTGNNHDIRILGLCISSLSLEPRYIPKLTKSLSIVFSKENEDTSHLLIEGLYPQQGKAAWTAETMTLTFDMEQKEDILFRMVYGTYYEDMNAVVSFNGTEVGRLTDQFAAVSFMLPKELLRNEGHQELSVTVPNAVSPKEYGTGTDERILGICISSFSIEVSAVMG